MAEREFEVCLTRMVEQTAKVKVRAASRAEAVEKGEALFRDRDFDPEWGEGDTIQDEHVYALLQDDELVWERDGIYDPGEDPLEGEGLEEVEDEDDVIVEENG